MRENVLIVDGNNLLFQFFYGFPAKIHNKSGRTIHATIGFISAFQSMLKRYAIDRAAVVFDCDCSQERKDLYQDYKANRPQNWAELPPDEVPFFEEDYIRKCLEYLGVCVLDSKMMEADDLIAALALQEPSCNQIYIASHDSDFFQLISENISVVRWRGQYTKNVTLESFCREYDFCPSRYPLYKSLVGDSADNVKGVPLIGAKRAAAIANACCGLDEIKCNDLLFLPEKARRSVKESFEIIERNLALIKLQAREVESAASRYCKERAMLRNSQILSECKVFD